MFLTPRDYAHYRPSASRHLIHQRTARVTLQMSNISGNQYGCQHSFFLPDKSPCHLLCIRHIAVAH
jgi:hypothetical protein